MTKDKKNKRIIINRSGFGYSTLKRQHKYWIGWITIHYEYFGGSYRIFDDIVKEGEQKGYEIIYK